LSDKGFKLGGVARWCASVRVNGTCAPATPNSSSAFSSPRMPTPKWKVTGYRLPMSCSGGILLVDRRIAAPGSHVLSREDPLLLGFLKTALDSPAVIATEQK
jgi:hypothetical protein